MTVFHLNRLTVISGYVLNLAVLGGRSITLHLGSIAVEGKVGYKLVINKVLNRVLRAKLGSFLCYRVTGVIGIVVYGTLVSCHALEESRRNARGVGLGLRITKCVENDGCTVAYLNILYLLISCLNGLTRCTEYDELLVIGKTAVASCRFTFTIRRRCSAVVGGNYEEGVLYHIISYECIVDSTYLNVNALKLCKMSLSTVAVAVTYCVGVVQVNVENVEVVICIYVSYRLGSAVSVAVLILIDIEAILYDTDVDTAPGRDGCELRIRVTLSDNAKEGRELRIGGIGDSFNYGVLVNTVVVYVNAVEE